MVLRRRATWILGVFIAALCITAMLTNNAGFDFWANTGVWSLLPPIVAIALTLVSGNLILSLFCALFVGAFLSSLDFLSLHIALLDGGIAIAAALRDVVIQPQSAGLLVLLALYGGFSALFIFSGGAYAIANASQKVFRGPAGAQIAGFVFASAISIDDTARIVTSAPILRPMLERHFISRERAAFLLRVSGSPFFGLSALVCGYGLLVPLLQQGVANTGMTDRLPFDLLLRSLPYCVYGVAILTLCIVSSISLRDFGPMRTAELHARAGINRSSEEGERAREKSLFPPPGEKTAGLAVAIAPLICLLVFSLAGLFVDGYLALISSAAAIGSLSWNTLHMCFYMADPAIALLPAGLISSIVAFVIGAVQGRYTVGEGIRIWLEGVCSVIVPAVVLVLCFALSSIMDKLQAGEFLAGFLPSIPAFLLPSAFFLLSCAVSLALGSPYGTLSLLIPLLFPIAAEMQPGMDSLAAALAAILGGVALGGHCSPAHPSAALSAGALYCSLRAHVVTMLPYALTAGAAALLLGYLPIGLGLPAWAAALITAAATVGLVFALGRRTRPLPDIPGSGGKRA